MRTGRLSINCHFFTTEEIEFDIDPREITGESDFQALTEFMRFVGLKLSRRVALTPEGGPDEMLLEYDPISENWNVGDTAI